MGERSRARRGRPLRGGDRGRGGGRSWSGGRSPARAWGGEADSARRGQGGAAGVSLQIVGVRIARFGRSLFSEVQDGQFRRDVGRVSRAFELEAARSSGAV